MPDHPAADTDLLLSHLRRRERPPGPAWLDAVREADFGAIPADLDWHSSVELAHLIDGYALVEQLRLGDPFTLANGMRRHAEATGEWSGNATTLWIALFLEHRRARFAGIDPAGEDLELLDRLCRTLRRRLVGESNQAAPNPLRP